MPERIRVQGPSWEDEKGRRDIEQELRTKGLRVVRVIEDRAGVGEYDLEVERIEVPNA